MSTELLQYLISGLTVGAVYGLVALGFSLVFNSSGVINFAQGECVMLGALMTFIFLKFGLPLPLAVLLAAVSAAIAGLLIERIAIRPARSAGVFSLIVITIGVSILIQGLVQFFFGRNPQSVPPFSDGEPFMILGAAIQRQSLWMLGVSVLLMLILDGFFRYTRTGKSTIAVSQNKTAAELVGIRPERVLFLSFGLAGLVGGVAGSVAAPITMVSFDSGVMLGLKGFVAATLGGLGNSSGAVVGGLLLGLAEALTAGYISSQYKDAMPFVLIVLVLMWRPQGLLSMRVTERV
jgi:branched-chain amino acid transport system permease protein